MCQVTDAEAHGARGADSEEDGACIYCEADPTTALTDIALRPSKVRSLRLPVQSPMPARSPTDAK
jgi:hypothetical protein